MSGVRWWSQVGNHYWKASVEMILSAILADSRYAAATDEEVVDLIVTAAPSSLRFDAYTRRMLVTLVAERRGGAWTDEPTDYAREVIARINEAWPAMKRSRRTSKSAMATHVGIDRDSITEWTRRGWMTWPPPTTPRPRNPRS